jgi:hypothetical protein
MSSRDKQLIKSATDADATLQLDLFHYTLTHGLHGCLLSIRHSFVSQRMKYSSFCESLRGCRWAVWPGMTGGALADADWALTPVLMSYLTLVVISMTTNFRKAW